MAASVTGHDAGGARTGRVESGIWKHVLLIVLLLGFSALILGGFAVFRSAAPVPATVAAEDGAVLFDTAAIKGGQAIYQKYGLMDYPQ